MAHMYRSTGRRGGYLSTGTGGKMMLARKNMAIMSSGVFWPLSTDPLFPLVGASDHRLVWVDARVT